MRLLPFILFFVLTVGLLTTAHAQNTKEVIAIDKKITKLKLDIQDLEIKKQKICSKLKGKNKNSMTNKEKELYNVCVPPAFRTYKMEKITKAPGNNF